MTSSSKPLMRSIKAGSGKRKKDRRKSPYQKKNNTATKEQWSSGRKVKENKKSSVRRAASHPSRHARAEVADKYGGELYRLLFENSAVAILLTRPDGRVSAANPEACRMFGRSEKEIIKIGRAGVVDAKDPRLPAAIEERRRRGNFRGELNCVNKDGAIFPGDISTTIFKDSGGNERMAIFIRNLSERKRAEEELRESEEKLRVLFEQLPIGVTLLDQNRKMIYANPALEKILDISRDDLLKGKYQNRRYLRPDGTSMPPEEYASVRVFQKQQPVHDVETGVITESGKTIWTSVSATPFPVAGKGVVIATVDITERKRAEEELRKSESNLRAMAIELSRAEERERQRLAIFLHDEIGQTLALLRIKFGGLAGAWRSKSGKQSIHQIRELLEKVIDQAHTLTFELSPPILHQLGLEAAVEWAGEKISQDHGIDFTFNEDGANKPLDADLKTLLFRCVRELMLNTVKHAKAKRLFVAIAREGEKILMTIIDDGIGFDISLLGRQSDLVGFGLFSVRECLAAVGGTFELRSEPGRGTRVTLSAPLKKEIPSSGVS